MKIDKDMKKRIRFMIRDKNMTQADVSKRLGYSESSFTRRLNGYDETSDELLTQIAFVLGTSREWIFSGGEYEPNLPENTIGERLTKQIYKRYLTKKEFADAVAIDESAVRNWCLDKSVPSVNMIIYLHEVLEVTTDYILVGN